MAQRRKKVGVLAQLLAIFLALGAVGGEQPDSVMVVDHNRRCTSCRVQLTKVVTLGENHDSVTLAPSATLQVDSRSRFFVLDADRVHINIFDTTGRLVRVFGRKGPGPGELPGPITSFRVGRGDSLYVLTGRRLHVFDPSLRFSRFVDIPGTVFFFFPIGGELLVGARLTTPRERPFFYHILNARGAVVRSFGLAPDSGVAPAGRGRGNAFARPPLLNYLDPHNELLWQGVAYRGPPRQYEVKTLPLAGGRGRIVRVINVPWLPAPEPPVLGATVRGGQVQQYMVTGEPDVSLGGVDANGNLWFTGLVPVPGSRGTPASPVKYTYKREVINPTTGQVLVAENAPGPLFLLGASGFAYSGSVDASTGLMFLTIWRAAVKN